MMRAISVGTDLFSKHWKEFIAPQVVGLPQNQRQDRVYRSSDIPNGAYLNISWDFMLMSRFLRSMDYGPFKLLPSPKVDINGEIYLIKHYEIDLVNKFKNQEIRFSRTSEGHINGADLLFKEGTIKLVLIKGSQDD